MSSGGKETRSLGPRRAHASDDASSDVDALRGVGNRNGGKALPYGSGRYTEGSSRPDRESKRRLSVEDERGNEFPTEPRSRVTSRGPKESGSGRRQSAGARRMSSGAAAARAAREGAEDAGAAAVAAASTAGGSHDSTPNGCAK